MPTLCPFLTVPWVCLQSVIVAFLSHTLSFFETITIVDENTIVLHKLEAYICSSLNKLKIIQITREEVIRFRGLCKLLYFSVRKLKWHVLLHIEH